MTDTSEQSSRADLNQVLEEAVMLHRGGRVESSILIYRQVLEQFPGQPDALHYLGMACYSRGEHQQAIGYILEALSAAPDYVEALNNLGVIYQSMGEWEQAENCYRKVIELRPEHSDSHNNLGIVLKRQGRMRDAGAAFEQALSLDPDHARAHHNLGNLYRRAGHLPEAIRHFRAAIDAGLQTTDARQALVNALFSGGKSDEAIQVLDEWLQIEPDHPIARHVRASLLAETAPSRASDDYVRTIFDGMASSFDDHLGGLQYRAPELVVAALAASLGTGSCELAVLDAGCGTGLCGPLVKPLAAHLTGVDLSSGMLRNAGRTGVYDELFEGELTAFLQQHQAVFDAIISADTLCYFGDLVEVCEAAAGALKPDGRFVFTVERLDRNDGDGYVLHYKGRYSHREQYVRDVVERAGFSLVSMDVETIRRESGSDVQGLVVCAGFPSSG